MTESNLRLLEDLVSELGSLVDRAQTRDEHVRATSALDLARRLLDQASAPTPTVSGSASLRTSDQRP